MNDEKKFIGVAVQDGENPRFHVAVKTKNVPGALGDVASRFGRAGVNILSTSNYSGPGEDECKFGFFVDAPGMDGAVLSKAALASPYVLECQVRESSSPLLVDDFAFPTTFFPSGRGIIFPQTGIIAMFREMARLFGTGGNAILFHAGRSAGMSGAGELARMYGEKELMANPRPFAALYAALGWGRMDLAEADPASGTYRFSLTDGFESSGTKARHPNCHFTRGLVAGSTERIVGRGVECTEEECASSGSDHCEFVVKLGSAALSRSGSSSS